MRKIRKGDNVVVLAGRDKGKRGDVSRVVDASHVVVNGINTVKRHTRPNPLKNQPGGIVTREAPIHVSNVMLVDEDGKATRVGSRRESVEKRRADGTTYEGTRRVRVARRTGKDIE